MLSHLSCVQLCVTPWTVAHQASLSMGILQARILEWVAMACSRGWIFQPESRMSPALAGRFFTTSATSLPYRVLPYFIFCLGILSPPEILNLHLVISFPSTH